MSSLAALGFYGTQRYLVTARRGEYAVRSALGADPQSLARLVITRAFVAGLPGLVVGSVPAFAATPGCGQSFCRARCRPRPCRPSSRSGSRAC